MEAELNAAEHARITNDLKNVKVGTTAGLRKPIPKQAKPKVEKTQEQVEKEKASAEKSTTQRKAKVSIDKCQTDLEQAQKQVAELKSAKGWPDAALAFFNCQIAVFAEVMKGHKAQYTSIVSDTAFSNEAVGLLQARDSLESLVTEAEAEHKKFKEGVFSDIRKLAS